MAALTHGRYLGRKDVLTLGFIVFYGDVSAGDVKLGNAPSNFGQFYAVLSEDFLSSVCTFFY